MKVFCLTFDRKRYQAVGRMPGLVENHQPTNANAPLLTNWQPMTGVIDDSGKQRGDFLLCRLEYLVCKPEITQAFASVVRDHVQVLPVGLEGEPAPYDLWNIKTYVDALDLTATRFKPPPFRSMPEQWVFKPECFRSPMLFRTPEVPSIVLAVTGFGGPAADDFYLQHRALGLKGLKFELVWESTNV